MLSKSIIKYIQSLQHKKFRCEHHAFVAEGAKLVGEMLQSRHFKCKNIYATSDWIRDNENLLSKDLKGISTLVEDFELDKLSALATPNSVVAEFQMKEQVTNPVYKNKLTILLDDIRDPGNFGTIIRLADWFGIENIICSEQTVDMYNQKVVQSTMASLGRVNIIYTDLVSQIKMNSHINTYASTLDGRKINKVDKIKEGFIIIGNESKGISKELIEIAKYKITIPKSGSAESLNAAVATGIVLYALSMAE